MTALQNQQKINRLQALLERIQRHRLLPRGTEVARGGAVAPIPSDPNVVTVPVEVPTATPLPPVPVALHAASVMQGGGFVNATGTVAPPTSLPEVPAQPPVLGDLDGEQSGEYHVADELDEEELDILGPADDLQPYETVVEISVEPDEQAQPEETLGLESSPSDEAEAPPESGRALVATPLESARVPVAAPLTAPALDEAVDAVALDADANRPTAHDVASASWRAPTGTEPPEDAVGLEAPFDGQMPPLERFGEVGPEQPPAPVDEPPITLQPSTDRPARPDTVQPVSGPTMTAKHLDLDLEAREAESTESEQGEPLLELPLLEPHFVTDESAPEAAGVAESTGSVAPVSAEISTIPPAAEPLREMPAVVESPAPPHAAAVALRVDGVVVAPPEKSEAAVVAIDAVVVHPQWTPMEVAAFVGAVREFKPRDFGDLIDVALSL